jgi:hypothetical protein
MMATTRGRSARLARQPSGVVCPTALGATLLCLSVAFPSTAIAQPLRDESSVAGQLATAAASYREFPRRPPVLSDVEAERLSHQVMARCGLTPDASHLPWYYFYELGLALEKRGDAQRALDAFVEATDRRPQPERRALMYGMWYIDYLPYFAIAKLHHELGNTSCAWDALRLSRQYGEVAEGQPADERRRELVLALQSRLLRDDEP